MEEKHIESGAERHICQECGTTFEGHFCHACGAKAQGELTYCPVCGIDRVEGAPFCANCGFSFVVREAEPAHQAPATTAEEEKQPAAPVAPSVDMDLYAMSQLDDMYIQPERYSSEMDFKYRVNKRSGVVTITKYIGNDREVCVPPTIEGKPVVKIDSKAFGENVMIRKVVLPEGLKTLDDWVFFCCTNLESISFPSTLTKVGLSQCTDCGNLREIIVAKGNRTFYSGCNALVQRSDNCLILGAQQIPYGVSEIGTCAFVGRFHLTEITIPETVKKLCYEAFFGCKNLTKVTMTGNTVEWESRVFENCTSLTYFVIPEGIKKIGGAAFNGCKKLEYVVFPDSLVEVEGASFSECPRLKTFYCTSKHIMRNWHPKWNEGCKAKISTETPPCFVVTDPPKAEKPKKAPKATPQKPKTEGKKLPAGYKKVILFILVAAALAALVIGGIVFTRSSFGVQIEDGITTLHIYKNMAVTGNKPMWKRFYPDLEPQFVEIEEGVTKIGNYAFERDSIVSISIASTVNRIEPFAFAGCNRLYEVQNLSPVSIGDAAAGVHRIYGDEESYLTVLEDGHILYETGADKTVVSYVGDAKTLVIPEGVTVIADHAYAGCNSFDSIQFPASVTTIGVGAFAGCQGLIAVNIPDSVTIIEASAFANCKNLEAVSFNCHRLEDNAFANCESLNTVVVGDDVARIGQNAFLRCHALDDFRVNTTGWKIYSYGADAVNGTDADLKNEFIKLLGDWAQYYLKRD